MRLLKYLSLIIVLVLAMGLNACSSQNNGNSSISSQSSESDFKDKTEITNGEMEILPGMIENIVTIDRMVLQKGSITMTLFRPNGEMFVTKKFSAPLETGDTVKLDLDLGVWKMKLDYEGASGNFLIKWNAHN